LLEAAIVYSFKKDDRTYFLYVDSVRRKSEYWLENEDRAGNMVEVSEKVYTWEEAVSLLEAHDWARYEYHKMDLSYADWIAGARAKSLEGQRLRPHNAQQRLLEILKRLERNETVKMKNAVDEFRVGNTQIQRDIKTINDFFYEHSNKHAEYVRAMEGYELNVNGDFFTIDDALIVLLLLYGTRGLNMQELKSISEKLIGHFSRAEQIKLREFFRSYLYHYQPVQQESLFELFYQCFQAISEKRVLTYTYTNNKGKTSVKEVLPVTITYHDSKFYLFARLKGRENDAPRVWQMDRIEDCLVTNERFRLSEADVNIGEYIRKSFNMYVGDPQKVRLRLKESNIPFLKRRFPEVSISPTSVNGWYDVDLEVNGLDGIKLWILQQGQFVEVIEPLELREKVKQDIAEMYQLYVEPLRI
jgi:predicted DNA-binding transcriptional regulator YafY